MWTCWEKDIGILELVAKTASRSLRRERRMVDSSADGEGLRGPVDLLFEEGREAGGLLVASLEALLGRDVHAASRFLEWRAQNSMYRFTILS